VRALALVPERMRAALDEGMLATDLADYLVRRGVPFRQAHGLAGLAVRLAEAKGVPLSALALDDYRALSDAFGADVTQVFDFDAAVARRAAFGGTGEVSGQLARARAWLGERGGSWQTSTE